MIHTEIPRIRVHNYVRYGYGTQGLFSPVGSGEASMVGFLAFRFRVFL